MNKRGENECKCTGNAGNCMAFVNTIAAITVHKDLTKVSWTAISDRLDRCLNFGNFNFRAPPRY
jgi:hypothetical protein